MKGKEVVRAGLNEILFRYNTISALFREKQLPPDFATIQAIGLLYVGMLKRMGVDYKAGRKAFIQTWQLDDTIANMPGDEVGSGVTASAAPIPSVGAPRFDVPADADLDKEDNTIKSDTEEAAAKQRLEEQRRELQEQKRRELE